ncbi:MAG: hypothetical protein ACTHL8_08140 [Burkholderiaceae bacterium]
MGTSTPTPDDVVDLSSADGIAFIAQSTPLTRLHYFDGKFLRADAFTLEQDYHRTAIRLANLAGGWGVVDGLGVSLDAKDDGLLDVGAGLAVTAAGSFIYAVGDLQAKLSDLLATATPAPAGGGNADFGDCAAAPKTGITQAAGPGVYEITVGPVEGLCGNEAVFGKICEGACASDSQRPYWREGVVLRLRPIALQLPASTAVTLTTTHLRNRVASAYFAAEPWLTPSALSAAGLDSDLWCNPATPYGRDEVVIGLLVRDGAATRVIDAWSGRRERMDTQARGYWQGRMAMRPWNVFVAQVLQFQCQLSALFDANGGLTGGGDDCERIRRLLDSARTQIDALHKRYSEGALRILQKFGNRPTAADAQSMVNELRGSYADLYEISQGLAGADLGAGALPVDRMLLNAGFVELPPAGYLPVVPGQQPLAAQLSRMFGEGVALTFHAVRHDEIAHLVEEAQHLDRISLTRGLDDPAQVEQVEVFVPDGTQTDAATQAPGRWWQAALQVDALGDIDLGLERSTYTLAPDRTTGGGGQTPVVRPPTGTLGLRPKARAAAAQVPAPAPAKKRTGAGAQQVAAPPAQSIGTARPPALAGLARTGASDDMPGGYGFTLVVAADASTVFTVASGRLAARQQAGQGGDATVDDTLAYIAADISADPFDLAKGAQATIAAEVRMGDVVSTVSGALTVLGDRPLPDGDSERLVHVSLTIATAHERIAYESGDLALHRTGDPTAGEYAIDDAAHDPATPPLEFAWRGSPMAAIGVLLQAARLVAIDGSRPSQAAGGDPTGGTGTGIGTGTGNTTAERLVRLDALPAMPGITDAVGAAAMNALIRIGDATGDDAFVARARRRLFPTLDAPSRPVVSALRDWVMFRRRRTTPCCPGAATSVKAAIDTIKVWHLKVADAEAAKTLISVLDRADPAALAQYAFQPVGLLRYGDADTAPVESPDLVLAMWRAARPGTQVVAGRYWESAPATGQNWQNNFRLTALLKQIASLTTPPPSGRGAIAPLVDLAAPLLDTGYDGGMLVVTQDAGSVASNWRSLLADSRDFKPGAYHPLDAASPRAPLQYAGTMPVGDAVATYVATVCSGTLRVRSLSLETTQAPDANAAARLAAVAAIVQGTGMTMPGAAPGQVVAPMSPEDQRFLKAVGVDPASLDEVVYLELEDIGTATA